MSDIHELIKIHGDNLSYTTFYMKVVGTTFRDGVQDLLNLIKGYTIEKVSVVLEREYKNEYDPYAVRVYLYLVGTNKRKWIGYIPMERSEEISSILESNEYAIDIENIIFSGGSKDKPYVGVGFAYKVLKVKDQYNYQDFL